MFFERLCKSLYVMKRVYTKYLQHASNLTWTSKEIRPSLLWLFMKFFRQHGFGGHLDLQQLTAFLWLGFLLAQNLLFFWHSYALTFIHVGTGLGSLSDIVLYWNLLTLCVLLCFQPLMTLWKLKSGMWWTKVRFITFFLMEIHCSF